MDRFIGLFPLVLRNEDLTAVNRMRIACRRLEQILELVYAKPRPRQIRRFRRRLKLCRHTLGKLRDCDALLAIAGGAIANKDPEAEAWEMLRGHLIALRQRTAQVTLRRLGRVNLAIPYLRVKRDLDFRRNESAIARRGAVELLYRRILHSLDRRWNEFAGAVEQSHQDPSERAIHQMRIAAKRLRYLTEVTAKLHISGSRETLAWLKALQRTVGVWHDLEIMEKLLRNMPGPRRYFRVQRLAEGHLERLVRHNREMKKQSARQFFRMTRRSREYQQAKKWVQEILQTGMRRPIVANKPAA